MLVYVFRGSNNHLGCTPDKSGSNLPAEFGPWQFDKQSDLQSDPPWFGLNVTEAVAQIVESGFDVAPYVIRTTVVSSAPIF